MKTTMFNRKAFAFLGAAVLLAAVFAAGCSTGTKVNYITVTGLTAAELKGEHDFISGTTKPSPLGKILNDNKTKKVVLKFDGDIAGLTSMFACFYDCTSLTQVPTILAGVVHDMTFCFKNCENLQSAVLKFAYPEKSSDAFSGCTRLAAGSIKVPVEHLQTYQKNAGSMGVTADRFIAE